LLPVSLYRLPNEICSHEQEKPMKRGPAMPLDATGTYRHNDESAAFHSKAAGKEQPKKESAPKEGEGADHVEIHKGEGGAFHTIHGGEKVDHPTHGHALIHAAKIHAEEGHKHFHAHHDGAALHSHSASSEQEPESRDHENTEGAHQHMDEAMGEGGGEGMPQAQEEEQQPAGAGLGGLY
jgi:hypothetical protein